MVAGAAGEGQEDAVAGVAGAGDEEGECEVEIIGRSKVSLDQDWGELECATRILSLGPENTG